MEQNWNNRDIRDQLRHVIAQAIESKDFNQINKLVGGTVNSALEEARQQFIGGRDRQAFQAEQNRPGGPGIQSPGGWQSMESRGVNSLPPREPPAIRVNWKGKLSGILYTVFGSIGSGVFGIAAITLFFVALFTEQMPLWVLSLIFGCLAAGFAVMLSFGISRQSRISRLKGYLKELKRYGKTYCETERLARVSGKSLPFIQKDLRKIIGLGMLPDVRMDDGATCVMLDEETYCQYKRSKEAFLLREQEQKKAETAKTEGRRQGETPAEAAVRRGQEYMDTLDRLRESMPGRPVYAKLMRLDTILERLFEALRKYPDQLDELEKFMEYYLPTTVKLVSAYQEFSGVEFRGENLSSAKKEIEETLDTINTAFENLLDDFYKDAAFDAVTDASVLQTVLAREGLTAPDFEMDDNR